MDSKTLIIPLLEEISNANSSMSTDGSLEPHVRRNLQDLVKQLGFALESPFETLNRLVVLPFQHAVVRVAINLALFEYMVEAGLDGKTEEEIKAKTGVDELLLPRLLRTLTAIGLLSQLDEQRWAATRLTHVCTIPTVKSGYRFMWVIPSPSNPYRLIGCDRFDFIGPVFQKLPESLAKRDYRCPTATQGPLQDAYNTKLNGWEFFLEPQFAVSLQDCNLFMKGRRQGSLSWLDFYPFAENILARAATDAESVLVVDVGGGLGHGLVEIKEKFPQVQGRLILQDLPKTIEQRGNSEGVFEPMAHDFFTHQPVQGPRAFLIRQVLHDWPDQECQQILQHLAAAMQPGHSKVLINEFVLADVGASDFITAIDLVMMGMSGGMERTVSQWNKLLASAGLRIEKIWTLDEETESVIEAVLSETPDPSRDVETEGTTVEDS
ncbi:MAG: hypothetical protein Q9224_001554 [Gallowayella concinna]